jgi:signal transduction histidine kinase/ligand-binding sensor domain-containing protein
MVFAQGSGDTRWSKLVAPVFQEVAYSEGQLGDADKGLPFTEMPTALAVDREGFLWVGTQNGLERWDGYGFRTFSTTGNKSGELPNNFINVLHVDAIGRLWIGTQAGGLAWYDRDNDRFVTIPVGPSGLSGRWVFSIVDDGAGGLWVGTSDGLNSISADGKHIVQYKHRDHDVGSLPDNYVRALIRDHSGTLWVGTKKGLARRDPNTGIFLPIQLPVASVATPHPQVRTLFESSRGRIWIGTRRNGAYTIALGSVIAEPLLGGRDHSLGISGSEILSASETDAGVILLGTNGQGILAVNPNSLATSVIAHSPWVPTSLSDDTVWALQRDRSGAIWVGSGHGISYYKPQRTIETVFLGNAAEEIVASDVNAMLALRDGRILASAGRNGFDIIDPEKSRIHRFRQDPSIPEASFPRDGITSFAASEDGTVFIGTRAGLYLADNALRHISRVPIGTDDPATPIFSVLCIDKRLWVGGPAGLIELAPQTDNNGSALRWNVVDRVNAGLVSAIAPASAGAIWVGTARGLFLFDIASHFLTAHSLNSGVIERDESLLITSLLTDHDGQLWIGTNGQGVYVMDPSISGREPSSPRLHIVDALPNSGTDLLLQDASGYVWVSTNNGLASINPRDGAVQTIDRGDGLAISNYWLGSGLRTTQGELIFGGQGGFTIVHPDRVRRSSYAPPIVATAIAVENVPVASSKFNDPRKADVLAIPSGAKSFAVDFAALDYLGPDKIRYAYKLEGYDRDWIQVRANRRMAAYTNIPPGPYVLHVRSTNYAGIWSAVELRLPIAIAPAWYQHSWVHLVESLLVIAFVWMIVQARTLVHRIRQRELASLVDRRTVELQRAHEERRALIENIAHDLRTPLTSLSGYLETVEMNGATLSVDDRHKYLTVAIRQCNRLSRMVRELFDLVRLEELDIKLTREPIQVEELVQDVVVKFERIADHKQIVFHTTRGSVIPPFVGDIGLTERMIDNVIDNAIRHTPIGGCISVNVTVTSDGQWIQIDIADTGEGIGRDDMSSIFKRFKRGQNLGARGDTGAGLGLAIVERIVNLHRGQILVQSEMGVGTRFTIRLPLAGAERA